MRVWLGVLLLVPAVTAQVPGIEDAITDGVAFELDSNQTVERLQAFADDVSGVTIHDCVMQITTDAPYNYRLMGSPTQSAFVDRYQNVFGEMGLPTALHHFEEGGAGIGVNTGTGGTNILGVLPGKDLTKWVVIGGHYDTREGTIGALDNTSGICTVKEIARAMVADSAANGQYEASIVFAWYDGEEWGLYGAVAFSKDTSVAKELLGLDADTQVDILSSQSFDMPGINYPALNIWPRYPEGSDPTVNMEKQAVLNLRTAPIHAENDWTCWSYGCYEELKQRATFNQTLTNFTNYQFLVREVAYDLMQAPPDLVWVYDDHYGRSDHIPLIAMGAAGMRIQGSHDEEYPCYHQPCDTVQWLYVQTGGEALLKAAYDAEGSIGGTVSQYVAIFGDHGQYGQKLFLNQSIMPRGFVADPIPASTPPVGEEAPFLPVVALLALLVLFARR